MERSAVLLSGGLDSVVMMALERAAGREVWPIHVRTGLAWEAAEAAAIGRVLDAAPFAGCVRSVTTLQVDMRDVYPATHWAVRGEARAYLAPDDTVYLEGRNITLIAKTAVFCAGHDISRLVVGPLAGNPFPDASPAFLDAMSRAMTLGLARPIDIAAPLAHLHKDAVIRLGHDLGVRFDTTLSCNGPIGDRHCGRCNKCRERRDAFRDANVMDPTDYVHAWDD
jgi:7-cyano-7-deazaguanine synthase